MRRTLNFVMVGALAVAVGAGLAWRLVRADLEVGREFAAGDPVENLTVKIDVGAGDELAEPIALDLGLGFPLWLYPVGSEGGMPAPFGAVAQRATAGPKVAPGTSATFTFELHGEAGQDKLLATPQLLAGVRISDIARVGFASPGANNWVLAGYEITINGRRFAANPNANKKAGDAQNAARGRLGQLGPEMAGLEVELRDLRALGESGLASADEQNNLREAEGRLARVVGEQRRLEAQLQGAYPWFEESDFRSPWREAASVKSLKVTVMTQTHPGADTENYVYYRTGGRKYLLVPAGGALRGEMGPQEFEIDLSAGPLAAADMRGHAVGMLAVPRPYGRAPNRWHPARVVVQIDGRIVYDSDENPIDHSSLEAIRVIPPAHLDERGEVVRDTPTARETFLWEAGKGLGLDLVAGGALGLPGAAEPGAPLPEPGLEGGAGPGAPGDAGAGDVAGGFDPGFPPFPGEAGPPGGWPGGPPPWDPGFPPPFWDPLWGPPPSLLDLLVHLLHDLGVLPPGVDPPPVGTPFQVENVRFTAGWRADDDFTLQWDVSGVGAAIDHFHVYLMTIDPAAADPILAMTLWGETSAHTYSGHLPAGVTADPRFYFQPWVVAVPHDPAMTPHERGGPAKPIFPATATVALQPALGANFFHSPPVPAAADPVSGVEPPGAGRAVWRAGQVDSHNAILFDNSWPGYNLGVRPEAGDDKVYAQFVEVPLAGKYRILAHVGFQNGAGAGNTVDAKLHAVLIPLVFAPPGAHVVAYDLDVPGVTDGGPMKLVDQTINTADTLAAGPCLLVMNLEVHPGVVDPAYPPILVGVRLIPTP